jgi:hypothetical protein
VDNRGKFLCTGTAKKIDSKSIEITELPIRKWTDDYKKQLEDWIVGTEKEKTEKEKAKVGETFIKVRLRLFCPGAGFEMFSGLSGIPYHNYRPFRRYNV